MGKCGGNEEQPHSDAGDAAEVDKPVVLEHRVHGPSEAIGKDDGVGKRVEALR